MVSSYSNVVSGYVSDAIKYYKRDDEKFKKSMAGFYSEGKKNPTVAKVILKEKTDEVMKIASNVTSDERLSQIKFNPVSMEEGRLKISAATSLYSRAIDIMGMREDKILDTIPEKAEFDKVNKDLYPRTADLRERYISENQIKTGEIVPKATYTKKQFGIKTVSELKKTYPKTHGARAFLILIGQIKDDGVMPKLKGFINRKMFRPFIEKGFGFKK